MHPGADQMHPGQSKMHPTLTPGCIGIIISVISQKELHPHRGTGLFSLIRLVNSRPPWQSRSQTSLLPALAANKPRLVRFTRRAPRVFRRSRERVGPSAARPCRRLRGMAASSSLATRTTSSRTLYRSRRRFLFDLAASRKRLALFRINHYDGIKQRPEKSVL